MTMQPLGSRYLLEETIGQGGMGVVWRGQDRETGTPCAIKILRPEFAADPVGVARFVRERTALVRFRHPNVVVLRDMIVEGDRLALVMDLVDGGDLDNHRRYCGGTLSRRDALGLTAQVCDALAAAHAAGIVHRDLKPANVLLDAGQVRLADFGIARILGDSPATTTGGVIGTVGFMAPEVLSGEPPTAACDVYAVGIMLYELLTGTQPFTGPIAAIIRGHLDVMPSRPGGMPGPLWALTSACLSKDPGGRPPAAVVARMLRDPALLQESALPGQTYGAATSAPAGMPPDSAYPRPPGGRATASVGWPAMVPQAAAVSAGFQSPPPVSSLVTSAVSSEAAAEPTSIGRLGVSDLDQPRGKPTIHRQKSRMLWAAVAAVVLVLGGGLYLEVGPRTDNAPSPQSSSLHAVAAQNDKIVSTKTSPSPAKHRPSTAPAASTSAPSVSATGAAATGQATTARATTGTSAAPATTTQAPAATPGPVGPNLLTDGDFTQPNLDDWEPVSNSFLVTGEDGEANAVQMSGPTAGVNQVVSGLTAGKSYEVTGWIISDTGNDTTMIGAKDFDSTDGISRRVSSTSWTEVTMTFTLAAGYTSADVFCWQVVAGNGYCTGLSLQALG